MNNTKAIQAQLQESIKFGDAEQTYKILSLYPGLSNMRFGCNAEGEPVYIIDENMDQNTDEESGAEEDASTDEDEDIMMVDNQQQSQLLKLDLEGALRDVELERM